MKPFTFEDGLMLGFALNKNGKCDHPTRTTYVENDANYVPPDVRAGETFDTYTEVWVKENVVVRQHVWGIGMFNRGAINETVTRLIYPDRTYVEFVGF